MNRLKPIPSLTFKPNALKESVEIKRVACKVSQRLYDDEGELDLSPSLAGSAKYGL